jgi:hypothetical protein
MGKETYLYFFYFYNLTNGKIYDTISLNKKLRTRYSRMSIFATLLLSFIAVIVTMFGFYLAFCLVFNPINAIIRMIYFEVADKQSRKLRKELS